MKPRFTVEPGREIHKDGKPFISIVREGNTKPWDADEITQGICWLFNNTSELPVYAQRALIAIFDKS